MTKSPKNSYDALNRLKTVTDNRLAGPNNVTTYTYDAVGNLQNFSYPNGVTNLHRYDTLNRLTNLVWGASGTALAGYGYTLGPTGNRTGLTETNNGVRSYVWGYDNLFRLKSETITGAGPAGSLTYGYDDVGNRQARTNSGFTLTNQSFTFNNDDWVSTDNYDSDGNTVTNATGQPYAYDVEDRLTNFNSGQVSIGYNGDGVRTSKEVYEIKPDNVRSIALGEAQLQTYIDLFNFLDPRGGWHRGTSYTPPLTVPINALTYAVAVGSPVTPPGMILYKVFSAQQIIKKKVIQTEVADNAQFEDDVLQAGLNALNGAF